MTTDRIDRLSDGLWLGVLLLALALVIGIIIGVVASNAGADSRVSSAQHERDVAIADRDAAIRERDFWRMTLDGLVNGHGPRIAAQGRAGGGD